MNNKLNYSSLDDAWGKNIISNDKQPEQSEKYTNWKNQDNTLSISSNEILELKEEINKLKIKEKNKNIEYFEQDKNNELKPCSLVNEHVKKCSICRNNMMKELREINNSGKKYIENYNGSTNNDEEPFNLLETFENITPSQKNLLLVIIYGILIIVISDLIIKDTK